MKSINLIKDGREALWRITEVDREKLFRLLFHRYPESEWGTFFRFGYRRTRWGMLITWVNALKPEAGDLDRQSPIVEFRPRYIQRALASFEELPLAVGVIHSHPQGCSVVASLADDDMDNYYAAEFERFGEGRPYASLIVARSSDGQLSFSGRVFDRGNWLDLKTTLVIGKKLARECSQTAKKGQNQSESHSEPKVMERVAELLGPTVSQRTKNAVVGIVGCSGTGSPAAHVLARANIGTLVVVDPGLFKVSNHQRNHASRFGDLSTSPVPFKTSLALRMIQEISPSTKVSAFVGDVLDDIVLDELLRCDVILGCTDSNYARAALGDIANQYLVPVIDLAVQMRANDGVLLEQICEIARYIPWSPCPWCRKRVTADAIRFETSTEVERQFMAQASADAEERGIDGAQYWGGTPPPELTMGYLTTVVGAMGAGYAQNWILGASSVPHNRFQFDLGLASLGVVEDIREPNQECSCQRFIGWADQAKADRSVSKPPHWPQPIELKNFNQYH
jgi:ThiF family